MRLGSGCGKFALMKRLPYCGVTPDLPPTFAKRIILTNILGLLFGFNMSFSAAMFLYWGFYSLAVFTAVFAISEFGWIYCNHRRLYNTSRVGMLISSNLLGLAVSLVLPDTGYNRGFYVMAGLPFLLFSLKDRGYIFLGLLLPLILYPFSEWAQHVMPNLVGLSETATIVIRYGIGEIYVLLIFLMFLFLLKENDRAERKLELALTELDEQRARTFSSAKSAALGEMAAGISHEINNPMMAIGIKSDLLARQLRAPEPDFNRMEVLVQDVRNLVKRVAEIVQGMRILGREGSTDNFELVDLSEAVNDALALGLERFRVRGIRLETKFEPAIEVRGRRVQLAQVVLNLLNNAYDAVESLPEKWVVIECYRDDGKGHICLVVTDSGRGIPSEYHDRVFQPFFTTKPIGQGTGLGLSMSRRIAQDHGGDLSLDTKSVQTRFVLELPRP